jgi:ABC-type lipoprotein release transport system permease subunit
VLAVAAMSLLMLSIEQISERRRPIAALSAAGVPIGVLARGALWQTGIPVVVGVVLAVAAGLGLTAPILRLADRPMIIDLPVLLALAGATVAAVLLVTGLTMPLLRQVTRLDTLRSE